VLTAALTSSVAPALGCTPSENSDDPPGPDADAPTPVGELDPTAATAAAAALDAVIGHRAWLEAVIVAHPGLGARAQQVIAMHQAHQTYLAGLLGANDTAVPSPQPVPERRPEVGKAVVASLAAHEATLTELAVAAREPTLARLLASLGAATAQVGTAAGWGSTGPTSDLPVDGGLTSDIEQAALQRVLQREHASLWWYGVLGARTSASREPELFGIVAEGYRVHRHQRDQLDACLSSLGVESVAADPAYPLTWPTRTTRQRSLAVSAIEHDAAATYSWLVAQIAIVDEAGPRALTRRWAVTALRNAAIRELVGQGTPENFPGADEIADR